jgi:hypothetical protein
MTQNRQFCQLVPRFIFLKFVQNPVKPLLSTHGKKRKLWVCLDDSQCPQIRKTIGFFTRGSKLRAFRFVGYLIVKKRWEWK